MILFKYYDEDTHTQEVWYDSSMIYYTKMVENDLSNDGDLYVVFNNSSQFVYRKVLFSDYVLLNSGGIDISIGKTFNKVIKNKYDAEPLGKVDKFTLEMRIDEIQMKKREIEERKANTYFISGHRDLSEDEFIAYYRPLLDSVARMSDVCTYFVVGDYQGCDIMSQNYLLNELEIDPDRLTVYHMGDKPSQCNEKVTRLKGGFNNDEERDAAMTKASEHDIAMVRDHTKWSGTGQNILRRHLFSLK